MTAWMRPDDLRWLADRLEALQKEGVVSGTLTFQREQITVYHGYGSADLRVRVEGPSA